MDLKRTDPARLLAARFALERELCSVPSLTGIQTEQLRDGGLDRSRGGARRDRLAAKRVLYADLLLLTQDLSGEEELVCRLRYGGDLRGTTAQGYATLYDSSVIGVGPTPRPPGCAAIENDAYVETYERLVPQYDVRPVVLETGTLPTQMTAAGEELVRWQDGKALVRGRRARWPSLEEIAEATGLTRWQVQARIKSACAAVRIAVDMIQF